MNLSFIKLDINILNDQKIKLIRDMPGGNDMIVIWIGLLCLAMKSGRPGVLEVGDGIPYTCEWLSTELGFSADTIKVALGVFQGFNMIEQFENGEYYLRNFEKHQNLEKVEKAKLLSRETSKKYREKQKSVISDASRDSHVIESDETEEDLDKDKEEELEEDKIDYQQFLMIWNINCKNNKLSEIKKITDQRRKHIKARTNKNSKFYEDFEVCIEIINKTPFLLGQNDRNWKVDFDWIISNENNYIKIIEGKYQSTHDNSSTNQPLPECEKITAQINNKIRVLDIEIQSHNDFFLKKYGMNWSSDSLSIDEKTELLNMQKKRKELRRELDGQN